VRSIRAEPRPAGEYYTIPKPRCKSKFTQLPYNQGMTFLTVLSLFLAALVLLFFGGFALTSLREREPRAALVASLFTLLTTAIFLLAAFSSPLLQIWILGLSAAILILFILTFLLPFGRVDHKLEQTSTPIDERRVVFSRNELQPGSQAYTDYYQQNPQDLPKDDLWRANPGLLSPYADFAEPYSFAAATASFDLLKLLAKAADGPVASKKQALAPAAASAYIKSLAKYYGALEVGICPLNPNYVYTHHGRGPDPYGQPIDLNHHYAIAMTFEMKADMIASNPRPPGIMETGHEYLESARTALQLAAAIRNLGYPAQAHFEGNYQVIAPPIACDAGLGELGRMSLLMTPRLGPRVRLAVVTTDLPLQPDQPTLDSSVIDFCRICKKCARTCPSQAISFEDRQVSNGALRWRINPEACYTYWTQTGTDCGRCMSVCPYAHADSVYHHIIRWGIRKSGFFRRAALLMDDLFYGKNPLPHPAPAWTKPGSKKT